MSAGSEQQGAGATLESVIRKGFWHLMAEVRTAMPGRIESFDSSTRLASVRPMLSRRYSGDSSATALPVVQRVPLVEMRTGKAVLCLPVTKGDPVLLVFSDRAIDNWLGGDGEQPADPQDVRQHDLTDAFAILGGWPELRSADHPAPSGDAAELLVAQGTKIKLGNGADELLDILDQFVDLFESMGGLFETYALHFHGNAGADKPTDFAAWEAAGVTLTAIRSSLDKLKA